MSKNVPKPKYQNQAYALVPNVELRKNRKPTLLRSSTARAMEQGVSDRKSIQPHPKGSFNDLMITEAETEEHLPMFQGETLNKNTITGHTNDDPSGIDSVVSLPMAHDDTEPIAEDRQYLVQSSLNDGFRPKLPLETQARLTNDVLANLGAKSATKTPDALEKEENLIPQSSPSKDNKGLRTKIPTHCDTLHKHECYIN